MKTILLFASLLALSACAPYVYVKDCAKVKGQKACVGKQVLPWQTPEADND